MRVALALAMLMASPALAGNAVILVEEQVAEYAQAANAAKKYLSDAKVVHPDNAASALPGASVVLAVGKKALQVTRQSNLTVPVVYCMMLGLGRSSLGPLETGVPLESDPANALAQMKAVVPSAKRVGVVYNPKATGDLVKDAQSAVGPIGLTLVAKAVSSASEVKDAVAAIAGQIDILWLPPDPKLYARELFTFLLSFAAERKLPLFGFLDSFTQSGALASLSSDYADIGERAGKLAADIDGRGKGANVPPPVYAPGKLTINLNTAKALGIEVSAKAVTEAKQVFGK